MTDKGNGGGNKDENEREHKVDQWIRTNPESPWRRVAHDDGGNEQRIPRHDRIRSDRAGPGHDKRGRVGNVHDQAGSSGRPDTASRGGRRAGKRQVRCELSHQQHRNSKRRHHLAGSARIRELRLCGDRTGLHRRADVHGNRRWSVRRSVQHRSIRIPDGACIGISDRERPRRRGDCTYLPIDRHYHPRHRPGAAPGAGQQHREPERERWWTHHTGGNGTAIQYRTGTTGVRTDGSGSQLQRQQRGRVLDRAVRSHRNGQPNRAVHPPGPSRNVSSGPCRGQRKATLYRACGRDLSCSEHKLCSEDRRGWTECQRW